MSSTVAEGRRKSRRDRTLAAPVLHVITSTARRGAETFAVDLWTELAGRGRPGRTVALVDGGPAGLPVPVLGSSRFGLRTLLALRREARAARVVVAHGSDAVVACALATLGTRTPFVYRNIGDPSFWLDTPRRRRRMTWLLRRARATVALWDHSAGQLRELAGRAIDIRIIPTGVPARLFAPAGTAGRREAREALGLSADAIVAVYVGSLSSEKDVATAIAAIARIPEAELLVVGDGAEGERLRGLADGSAPGRIRFLGTRERPREELAAADVLVLSSRTEGIPAVLIEAAFSGLPVVATAVGGIPEVVDDGGSGFVVAVGDVDGFAEAIRKAAGNSDRMGRAGRDRCLERYEIGVVAAAWDELLGTLGAWEQAR